MDTEPRELWVPPPPEPPDPGRLYVAGQPEPDLVRAYDELVVVRTAHLPKGQDYRDTPFARNLPPEGKLVDLDALPYVMGRLLLTSETADLEHLKYGMYGYRQVTLSCIERLDEFGDSAKIEVTMPQFFDELVKAFRHHANGNPAAVEGWQKQFYSKEARQALPAVAMIDFLAAHVRYDLAVALYRTHTQDFHKQDYTERVNAILTDVAHDIINQYAEFPPIVRALFINELGLKMALRELFGARDEAWMSHLDMKQATDLASYAAIRREQKQRTEKRTLSSYAIASSGLRIIMRSPMDNWRPENLNLKLAS